ncbi:S41 family peptidase [Paraglaciecola sp.]|uniref:S41 family peptidase n=1 Tax=Paraglaciecola sp. TaxID=1920173 RepID=UPI003EF20F04
MKITISILWLTLCLFSCGGGEEAPESNPSDDTAVPNPSDESPVSNPSDAPPVSNPSDETPVSNPSDETPVSNPSVETPVSNPSVETPVSNPSDETPVSNPSVETPVSDPPDDPPVSNPPDETPVSDPLDETPVSEPSDETPVSDPSDETPVSDPSDETPVSDPSDETPVSDSSGETPVSDSSGETPVSDSSGETPVSEPSDESPVSNPAVQPSEAGQYLSEVLAIMRENSVVRNKVDWGKVDTEVNVLAVNANSIEDTYPAITKALELQGTNHSFLRSSTGTILAYHGTLNCDQSFDIAEPVFENIGYVKVNGFSSSNNDAVKDFANDIQQSIAQQDNEELIGWVVDLRDNTGGNMWAMIAGLGPFFDDNILGHFIDVEENRVSWGYENGSSFMGERKIVTVDEPYLLLNSLPKVAILSSKRLASSGEAALIAFKKQFNVRVFGTDTCGLSTANQIFKLSDGSELMLTTAIMADREQTKYGSSVYVDQSEEQEDVLIKAVEWLQK